MLPIVTRLCLAQEKFASLSLAFKTDSLTLDRRIELHHRARDIAEQNIDRELEGLREAMKVVRLLLVCCAAVLMNPGSLWLVVPLRCYTR